MTILKLLTALLKRPIWRYNHPELISSIRTKTDRYRLTDMQVDPNLATLVRPGLRVLDFGGGFARDYWPVAEQVARWAVVETEAFIRAAGDLETDRLRFFRSCAEAHAWLGEVDLLWSSGALQYAPSPQQSLGEWFNARPRMVVACRMAWSTTNQLQTEWQRSWLGENGPGPLPEGVHERLVMYRRTRVPLDWLRIQFESQRYRVSVDGETLTATFNGR